MKKLLIMITAIAFGLGMGMSIGHTLDSMFLQETACGVVSPHADVAANEAKITTQIAAFAANCTQCHANLKETQVSRFMGVVEGKLNCKAPDSIRPGPGWCQVYNHPSDCQCGGVVANFLRVENSVDLKINMERGAISLSYVAAGPSRRGQSGSYIRTLC